MWLFRRIPCLRHQVLVNFLVKDVPAIRGVLWMQRGGWLVLKDASLVPPTGPPVPMDGDVVMECAQIAFVQVLG